VSKKKPPPIEKFDVGSPPVTETPILQPADWSSPLAALMRLAAQPSQLEQPDNYRQYPNCSNSAQLPEVE
jgi:hypothetical protein